MQIQEFQLFSPQLLVHRKIRLLLPKDYKSSNRSYPVIYMQDGQNLFNNKTAAFRSWGIDKIMAKQPLKRQAIIVGIDHGGVGRIDEFSPSTRRNQNGKADKYLSFLIDTVKVFIDHHFRTEPFRENTMLVGSSMGGLVSMYASVKQSRYFGKIGVFSPSMWYAPEVLNMVSNLHWKSQIYAVTSKTEMRSSKQMMEKMYWKLKENHYSDDQIRIIVRDRGKHNEIFWAKEFKKMLEWMMP